MFKLIGMIVFVVVLVVGYPALSRWYAGDATPKEAVDEIRGKLSDKSGKSNDSSHAAPPEKEVDNLQKMINEVNKK